jgi:hypothetical protein
VSTAFDSAVERRRQTVPPGAFGSPLDSRWDVVPFEHKIH